MRCFCSRQRQYLVMVWLCLMVVGRAQLPAASKAADLPFQHVAGPEFPGRYKHPAAIEELANGDLYLVYYGGEGEYAEDTAVFGMRRRKGQTPWSRPQVIADTPFRSEGNAVVWQAPDGLVWLFYVCRYGETWSKSRIKAKISRDNAETWSDSFIVAFDLGMMVRNRPLLLANGDYLLPVYHETGEDREVVGADSVSMFLRYDPRTHEWSESGQIRSAKGNIQPAVAAVDGDHLVAYCRRGGGYGPTSDGYLVRAESFDNGRSWTPGVDSQFPNPNAAVDFLRLRNGHLLLVYNRSMEARTPLSIAISADRDASYSQRRDLLTGEGPYAYPYAIQSRDDKIHLVFTSQERTVINHMVFTEKDLLAP
jgi:predicted neuraminidase